MSGSMKAWLTTRYAPWMKPGRGCALSSVYRTVPGRLPGGADHCSKQRRTAVAPTDTSVLSAERADRTISHPLATEREGFSDLLSVFPHKKQPISFVKTREIPHPDLGH